MKGLTPKQLEILNFIQTFIDQHHYSPSYREIMEHFQLLSPGSVYKFIKILKKKGALDLDKYSHRSMRPVEKPQQVIQKSSVVDLPLIGNITIGYPLELFSHYQTLAIPISLIHNPEHTYILQVRGDSLQEESIQDGDFLLIEARQDIHPGEIILGLINQHDTILKRYFPEGHYIRLESQNNQNPSFSIRHDHILIQGVLVGLFRLF